MKLIPGLLKLFISDEIAANYSFHMETLGLTETEWFTPPFRKFRGPWWDMSTSVRPSDFIWEEKLAVISSLMNSLIRTWIYKRHTVYNN